MKSLKILGFLAALSLCLLTGRANQTQQLDYDQLKTEAERFHAESSYARAYEIYLKAKQQNLSTAELRWVDFRIADCLWRSQASTQTADLTKLDSARLQLETLVRDIHRAEDRDRVWAEVQESLGDFYWIRRNSPDWSQSWTHYQLALDWWAGASNLEMARARYLKMVWSMARPPWVEPYYYYGYYGNTIPLEILENALKISSSDNDKAHAHYLIAMTILQRGGEWEQRQRVPEEFEAAIKPGKTSEWYDDALYHYAEWMAGQGRIVPLEDGQWRQEPDYVKGLELFQRLVNEYRKGETRYYDQAQQQIKTITSPALGVMVPNIFLPDSEIQFHLNWRNIQRIELALFKVDLTHDVRFSEKDSSESSWIQSIALIESALVKAWSKEIENKGDYKPGEETIRLGAKLPVGAYVLEAKSQGTKTRDLVLVTDAALVFKTSGKQALVYFGSALNGAPLSGARIQLWQGSTNQRKWIWQETVKSTNQDGFAVFDLPDKAQYMRLFVGATLNARQAFSTGQSYSNAQNNPPWRIYAFTDRPAYRPMESVQWKFLARRYNGALYSTPAHQNIEFEIHDPRGAKVKEGTATLNDFGSAWGSLDLTESMPLGEYQVNFWDEGRHQHIGNATLFRLEEYKLPEFKVNIQTPEEAGIKKAFRLGDPVEVTVQADYYFGGAVSNATVEVLVYQKPFYHTWQPQRDYPWFYEDMSSSYRNYWGEGQVIKRESLRTDATGKVNLSFDTPRNAQQDFEYRIEARVTDASRREILGSETVRVTRQRYYVYPRPEHNLYRPQDKVNINIKTLDANSQPLAVEGRIKLTRNYWYEIWLDSDGHELKGADLESFRGKGSVFPPLPPAGGRPWQLKFRGYQQDEIMTRLIKTGTDGETEFAFTPEREGYYRISWVSQDKGRAPIKAETVVWVARSTSSDLGYRHGGLEIILDKDTFRAGQKAPVMLAVPTADRYVLFNIEGDDLYSTQLVHVTGTVKLLELEIQEKHVPNIFLSAAMFSDRQLFVDTKQVIVPPIQHFLKVDVSSDRPQYQPREEGRLTITSTDQEGKPVSAEVALGMVDESVYYIQQDYAGDPRQFYFGSKRSNQIQTQSTLNMKSYSKLVEDAEKKLVDERDLDRLKKEKSGGFGAREEGKVYTAAQRTAGVVGGAIGGRMDGPMAKSLALAAPASEMASNRQVAMKDSLVGMDQKAALMAKPGQEPAVQVRSDFRSTVIWQPDIVTDKNGKAVVKVKYPDALTSWKAVARVASETNQFGMGSASTRTQQPLIVRLQAPRFFVVGDTVTVSAVINNNTEKPMTVVPALALQGLVLAKGDASQALGENPAAATLVKANGEARVDWNVLVQKPGQAKLKVTARSDKYADAMENEFTVYEHGIEKFISKSGKMRGDELTVKLDLPSQRKLDSTQMMVQITPSLAVTMLDALPYLIDYPYGCTEQTMSRFLPAAITAKTLGGLGLQPETVMSRVFGGIVQEHVDKTHSKGKKNLAELNDMVKKGLNRLYDFQHSDGGWGWWKEGESDHFMTAYVVWGLTLAREAGVDIKADVLDRGANFLDKEIVEEETNPDMQAWMLHALSAQHVSSKHETISKFQSAAYDNLWKNRDQLNAYTRALLALSAHSYGNADKARTLVQNLENGVKIDSKPDTSIVQRGNQSSHDAVMSTAHWGEDGIYWRWSEGGVEATSFALRALLTIDPKNQLVEPVVNWLIKNRRGAQWSNTRDTAITILALNSYLKQSGELTPDAEYELSVNNRTVVVKRITPADAFAAPSQFLIDRQFIRDGANDIKIMRRSGKSPLYFAVQAQFFSLEDPISPAGNEIFVRRQYYRLSNRPTLLKGFVTDRQPLNDGDSIRSGERAEVIITIEAKNNYEYLVFEDLKPAGLEAVQVRSGEPLYTKELRSDAFEKMKSDRTLSSEDFSGRTRWVYQELRDRKVALFIDKLPEGIWQIRYELRAEVPGQFHALPVVGHAMYVPEIRCNGAEQRIKVVDSE